MITAFHKGARQAAVFLCNLNIITCKSIRSQLVQQAHIEHGILDSKLVSNLLGTFDLQAMTLAVVEGNRLNFSEMLQCPEQAGGTVLSAAEYDDSFFIFKHKKTSLSSIVWKRESS
ncbi:hypothetical protein D3C81_1449470 [compost metagenome]